MEHFSLERYLERYGKDTHGFLDLGRHLEEFDDWVVDVPFPSQHVRILCCPEDK